MADKYKGRKISITFPDELFERISQVADTEVRSFSQQVVFLCMEAFKARDGQIAPG
ncbi:MAG: ribbon-helix-helix domain-containing protein, partial [Nostoc sp.]